MFKLKTYEAHLIEKTISDFSHKTKIEIEIDKTVHAEERQGRHSDVTITDKMIESTVRKALKDLIKDLVSNKLKYSNPRGDKNRRSTIARIGIRDASNDMNVIAAVEDDRDPGDDLIIKVITVMIEKKFNFSSDLSKVYDVS